MATKAEWEELNARVRVVQDWAERFPWQSCVKAHVEFRERQITEMYDAFQQAKRDREERRHTLVFLGGAAVSLLALLGLYCLFAWAFR